MSTVSKNCRFCDLLANPFDDGLPREYDLPIHKTDDFVLLPAIGPLLIGHVMIVSVNHYPSLLSMPNDIRIKFDEYVSYLHTFWGDGAKFLLAEHGSSVTSSDGACIAHTHINLLPFAKISDIVIDANYPEIQRANKVCELSSYYRAYFLLKYTGSDAIVHDAANAPSQYLRIKYVANKHGTDWDWRLNPNYDQIDMTISAWQQRM